MALSGYQNLTSDEVKETAKDYYEVRAVKTAAVETPIYVLVGGQPGAGKSAASQVVKGNLAGQGGYIHIDADRMRERIDTKGTRPTSDETQQDAGRLVTELRRQAISGQRNILEEGTFRNSDGAAAFLEARRQDGYKLEMVAVATAREESILGIYQRYELQHMAGAENPRFVSAAYHDDAMSGFAKTLAENEEKFERVRVINRSGAVLYDTKDTASKPVNAAQALREGQRLPDDRLSAVVSAWGLVEAQASQRGADSTYLEGLSKHRQECVTEMQSRMRDHALQNMDDNFKQLKDSPAFQNHTLEEVAKAAYFRGVYQKSSEFKNEIPDFKSYDIKMSDRSMLGKLPSVPNLEVPDIKNLNDRDKTIRGKDDGLSL